MTTDGLLTLVTTDVFHLPKWLDEMVGTEADEAKPCPKCGRAVAVNGQKRTRTLHAIHGTFRYERYHYYCRNCSKSFYPLDDIVGALDAGDGTTALQKRVLDFGMNAPYEEASERQA